MVVQNDEWTWEDVCHYLYEEKAFDNIVISPGPGSPACPTDIGGRMEQKTIFMFCFPIVFNDYCIRDSDRKMCT